MAKNVIIIILITLLAYLSLSHAKVPPSCLRIINEIKPTFDIKNALTRAQIEKGLMYVTHLPSKDGMLFHFNPPTKQVSFWMKNTLIPLDILFIDASHSIFQIVTHAKPHTLTKIMPTQKTRYVLEINAGAVKKFHIKLGDKIAFCSNKHDE